MSFNNKSDIRISKLVFGICFGFSASCFVLLAPAYAQENDLFLVVSPPSPSPGQGYSVEAKSFQFDASRAYLEWFKNGKKIDEGTGVIKKIFGGEKVGSQTTISVSVSADNNFYETLANIGVNDIDFIINPFTYTPAFYRGSALPTSGSVVEVYAIPHIFYGNSRISSGNLLFEWSLDGKTIQEQSGRGKNKLVFSFPKTPLGENEISVKVSSLNGALAHEKIERVAIQRPEIILYKTSSLLGKSAVAISPSSASGGGGFEVKSGEEFSVVAEPFFFDFNSILRSTISWLGNGVKINTGKEQNPFLLELTSQPSTESENNISFKIENKDNVFQKGESGIIVKIKP